MGNTQSANTTEYIVQKIHETELAKQRVHEYYIQNGFRSKPAKLARTHDLIRANLDLYTNVEALKKHLFGEHPEPEFILRLFFANAVPLSPSKMRAAQISNIAPYGAVHTGLQINEKIVHWLGNSLVMMTKDTPKSSSCFILFSPSETRTVPYTDEIGTKICQTIVEWNKTTYNKITHNCHHFANEIVRKVVPNYKPDNLIGRFIKDLIDGNAVIQEQGKIHVITLKLPSVPNKITFRTQDELDALQTELINKYILTENELKFLKTFHRGFQIKEFAEKFIRSCPHYGDVTICSKAEQETMEPETEAGSMLGQ